MQPGLNNLENYISFGTIRLSALYTILLSYIELVDGRKATDAWKFAISYTNNFSLTNTSPLQFIIIITKVQHAHRHCTISL